MTRFGRLSLGAAILCAGILVGAVFFSGRRGIALGAQDAQAAARPAVLLQVEPSGDRPLNPPSIPNEIRTDIVLIQTRKILDQALASPEVAKLACVRRQTDAASWLSDHLLVVNPEGTSLIRILLAPAAGATPQEQATLLNAIAKTFVMQNDEQERMGLDRRQELLEEERIHRAKQLAELEHELDSLLRRDDGKLAGSVPKDVLATYAMDLRRKRMEIDVELAGVKAVIARRQDKPPANQAESDERARLGDRLASLEAQEKVLDSENKQVEIALAQSSVFNRRSAIRLGETLRHQVATIERLEDQRGELAAERNAYHPRIRIVDPAVAR